MQLVAAEQKLGGQERAIGRAHDHDLVDARHDFLLLVGWRGGNPPLALVLGLMLMGSWSGCKREYVGVARLTLQPSASALATPACSILRLASWVSRWVGTMSGIAEAPSG